MNSSFRMTFEELLARSTNKKPRKKSSEEEHRLQVACVQWFRLQYPAMHHNLFAVPNGGRRDKVTAGKLKAEGALPGVADLILLRQSNGYGALLIEMKTDKGRQSTGQKEWQKKIEQDGYKYIICRSLEEFINEINKYLS